MVIFLPYVLSVIQLCKTVFQIKETNCICDIDTFVAAVRLGDSTEINGFLLPAFDVREGVTHDYEVMRF